ncbi:PQQ-binding-like beta-propeller repeat protein [Planctomycetota bacterium]
MDKNTRRHACIGLCLLIYSMVWADQSPSSGIADIDRVRGQVQTQSTASENALMRRATLYRWWRLLWRQGLDLRDFDDSANALINTSGTEARACRVIDRGFQVLEKLAATAQRTPEVSGSKGGGTTQTDWPQFHGTDGTQIGFSPDAGPSLGKLAWRFPKGYAWNARPVLRDGKVYVSSPGIDVFGFCLNEETGKVLWKARQYGLKYYSTYGSRWNPVVMDASVSFRSGHREMQLFSVDRSTGQRCHPRKAAPEMVTAYVENGQTLILADAYTGEQRWQYKTDGHFTGEPAIQGERVYVTLESGRTLCLGVDSNEPIWQRDLSGELRGGVSVGAHCLYVGTTDGCLFALNPNNGKQRWSFRADEQEKRALQFFSGVAEAGQRVYVGAASGYVYCLNRKDGGVIWKYAVSDWVRSRPLLLGDTLYVATLDSKLYALQDEGGTCRQRWCQTLGQHGFTADLVGNTHGLLASGRDLILYSIDPQSGRLQWRHGILDGAFVKGEFVAADWTGGLMASPAVVDGKVYIGGPDGFVNAVDVTTGKELWRFETGGAVSIAPRVAEGKVFFGHLGGTSEHYTLDIAPCYYAVDQETGKPVWQSRDFGHVWVGAAYAKGRLFFGNMDGTFFAVEAATGKKLWSYYTGKNTPLENIPLDGRFYHGFPPGVYCCPVVDDTTVYAGSWSGYYFAFDQETGQMRWRTATNNGNLHGGLPDSAAPALWKDHLYVQKLGYRLIALHKDSGEVKWEWKGPAGFLQNGTIAAHDDKIFGSIARRATMLPYNATILAFHDVEHGGDKLWEYRGGGGLTTPVMTQDKLIFGSSCDPFLTCLDPGSGTVKWRFYTGGEMMENSPALYGHKIFAHCKNGWLLAVE